MSGEPKYTIKITALKTGLNTDVVRIWERRYGAVVPGRTSTGHRLYSDADVERLRLLRTLTRAGHNISQLASIPTDRLHQWIRDESLDGAADGPLVGSALESPHVTKGELLAQPYLKQCQSAVENLDADSLEDALLRAALFLGNPAVIDDVIEPFLKRLDEICEDNSIPVAHQHMASTTLRTFLGFLTRRATVHVASPMVVITTPLHNTHEIGALLVAATSAMQGWRTLYLGPNLPAQDIALAVEHSRANALALSIVHPTNDARVRKELGLLSKLLPRDFPVLVGGRATESYSRTLSEMRALHAANMAATRAHLSALHVDALKDAVNSPVVATPEHPSNGTLPSGSSQEAVSL